jgi:large conductance mechanosensitive channel
LKVKDLIDSFMSGIVNPFIAGVVGKQNFDDVLSFHIGTVDQFDDKGVLIGQGALVQPGKLITALINLILVGLVLFIILKAYAKLKRKQEAAAPAGPSEVELLTEIRDALKSR